ncbi:MAG TPA: hypothetical protein VF899_07195 [Pyrinomonadaceae bacterium]
MRLFNEIVRDVWNEANLTAARLTREIETKAAKLLERKQRLIDVYVFDRAIDKQIYEVQLDLIRKEETELESELHANLKNNVEVDNVLHYANTVLTSLAGFWNHASLEQN